MGISSKKSWSGESGAPLPTSRPGVSGKKPASSSRSWVKSSAAAMESEVEGAASTASDALRLIVDESGKSSGCTVAEDLSVPGLAKKSGRRKRKNGSRNADPGLFTSNDLTSERGAESLAPEFSRGNSQKGGGDVDLPVDPYVAARRAQNERRQSGEKGADCEFLGLRTDALKDLKVTEIQDLVRLACQVIELVIEGSPDLEPELAQTLKAASATLEVTFAELFRRVVPEKRGISLLRQKIASQRASADAKAAASADDPVERLEAFVKDTLEDFRKDIVCLIEADRQTGVAAETEAASAATSMPSPPPQRERKQSESNSKTSDRNSGTSGKASSGASAASRRKQFTEDRSSVSLPPASKSQDAAPSEQDVPWSKAVGGLDIAKKQNTATPVVSTKSAKEMVKDPRTAPGGGSGRRQAF